MTTVGYVHRQAYGTTLLERLSRSPHASEFKKETQGFKAVHGSFTKACKKTDDAQQKRDDALAVVGEADGGLDGNVGALADAMVGAGLGNRRSPFTGYSPYAPGKLVALAYATEEKAARALIAKLRKKKLPAAVEAAAKRVLSAADGVAKALGDFSAPQADYQAAQLARDGLLLDWQKALTRLKRAAALAYDDDRAGYKALFAETRELSAPKRRVAKKPAKPKTPPPEPTGGR